MRKCIKIYIAQVSSQGVGGGERNKKELENCVGKKVEEIFWKKYKKTVLLQRVAQKKFTTSCELILWLVTSKEFK